TDRGMDSNTVVVNLDVLIQRVVGLLPSFKFRLVHEFLFQHAMEGFNGSIVVTVSSAAHAPNHLVRFQLLAVLMGGILRSSIGMMNDRLCRLLALVGHSERL